MPYKLVNKQQVRITKWITKKIKWMYPVLTHNK